MYVLGQLIKAQLEVLGSDPTPVSTGLIYFSTVALAPKCYNGTGWKTLVDTDTAQVLTLKDYDGGTASNTSRITLPKETTTNLNALTRKKGTIVYDTTTDQVKFDDGSTLNALSSASTATATTQGIVTAYWPVVASGASSVSSADATMTQNDGFETYLFTTGASNRTLNLAAAASSAGRRFIAKKIDSGAGALIINPNGAETIDGNATILLFDQYDGIEAYCDGSAWYVTQLYSSGSKSVTITGSFTNTTYTGRYRRVSVNEYEFWVFAACTGTPGAATFTITLPNSWTINTGLLPNSTTTNRNLGPANFNRGLAFLGTVRYATSSTLGITAYAENPSFGTQGANVTNAVPDTFVNGDELNMYFKIPITQLVT